ncbi:hypothetical protein VNI00_002064 [Paramarasmius palmivorus]|uniref:Uncharacterized protein n=1 Tax=Paramarasmius palmivorus TaxID=297713 RepID=A0AAW0E3X5_9AGAR
MQAYRPALVRRLGPSYIQFRTNSTATSGSLNRKAAAWGDVVIPSRGELVKEKKRLPLSDIINGTPPKAESVDLQPSPTPQRPTLKWNRSPKSGPTSPTSPRTTSGFEDLATPSGSTDNAGLNTTPWDQLVSALPGRKVFNEGISWTPAGGVVERNKRERPRRRTEARAGPRKTGQPNAGRGRGRIGGRRNRRREGKDEEWEEDVTWAEEAEPDLGPKAGPVGLSRPDITPLTMSENIFDVQQSRAVVPATGSGSLLTNVRVASPRRILRRYGGDYSHCTLKTNKTAIKDLDPTQLARLVLGKRPDVEFSKRNIAAEIIKATSATKRAVQTQ